MDLLDADGSEVDGLAQADCILEASDGTKLPATRSKLMLESQVFRHVPPLLIPPHAFPPPPPPPPQQD